MTLSRRLLIVAFAAALCGPATAAPRPAPAPAPTPTLTPGDKALVDEAAAYLEGLSAAKGRFVQTDARGAVTRGDIYLQRPGKARFAYDPPASLLIVSDGSRVSIYDRRLKTFNAYPLSATPLSLFLARHIRLDRGVRVTRVIRQAGQFSLDARDARHRAGGWIQLTFGESPLSLREWVVTDAQGATTRVRLEDLRPASGLDANLFVLHDPRAQPGM